MNDLKNADTVSPAEGNQSGVSRRTFFTRAAALGATAAIAGGGLLSGASAMGSPLGGQEQDTSATNGPTKGDVDILTAASIAEALAVTTYMNIIDNAQWFKRIADDDQEYINGALQEEMSHYALEVSVTGAPSPFTRFYYPHHMFDSAQTTLNTLVTLEDAFIAAYLVGVRNFSTPELRVTAARIMGIESDHRTLARALAPGIASTDGGPLQYISGAQGIAERVSPPNNNGYERTLCWTDISQAIGALLPFADATAAQKAGFDTSRSFQFKPFTAKLPSKHGAFFSLTGC